MLLAVIRDDRKESREGEAAGSLELGNRAPIG